MNKKLLKIIVTFCCSLILIFSFTACNSNQDLLDRIASLEQNNTTYTENLEKLNKKLQDANDANTTNSTEIETLQAKITALETANAEYQTNLTTLTNELETLKTTYANDKIALDTAIKENKDQADALANDLTNLTNSVANATHIERVVIKPEDVGQNKPIAKSVEVEATVPTLSERPFNVKIDCMLGHGDYSFNYQLVTFKTTLLINDKPAQNFNISVTQAKSGDARLSQTFNTNIPYDSSSTDTYTATWSEIILYRFI